MARKQHKEAIQPGLILLVDDNIEYLEITKTVLQYEGFSVVTATSGHDALVILKERAIDLILLDFFMPKMTGAEMVRELRNFNPHIQVVLQTGYASEHPARDLLRDLDIQGYFEKGEGTEKLLLWVEVGLKAARATHQILYHRRGLHFILDASSTLNRLGPIEGTCEQAVNLACDLASRTINGSQRTAAAWIAMPDVTGEIQVIAGETEVSPAIELTIKQAYHDGITHQDGSLSVLPLESGDTVVGVMVTESPMLKQDEHDLIAVFARQAATAIHNSQLFSLATQDPLTGTFMRKFYDIWLQKELRTVFRYGQCISLIMFDLDNMKTVNDAFGHPAGDAMLALVGKILLRSTRTSDFVARFGGDEFAIILPCTDAVGAANVGNKILSQLQNEVLRFGEKPVTLSASLGGTTLLAPVELELGHRSSGKYFLETAEVLLVRADARLYESKRAGKGRYTGDGGCSWPTEK